MLSYHPSNKMSAVKLIFIFILLVLDVRELAAATSDVENNSSFPGGGEGEVAAEISQPRTTVSVSRRVVTSSLSTTTSSSTDHQNENIFETTPQIPNNKTTEKIIPTPSMITVDLSKNSTASVLRKSDSLAPRSPLSKRLSNVISKKADSKKEPSRKTKGDSVVLSSEKLRDGKDSSHSKSMTSSDIRSQKLIPISKSSTVDSSLPPPDLAPLTNSEDKMQVQRRNVSRFETLEHASKRTDENKDPELSRGLSTVPLQMSSSTFQSGRKMMFGLLRQATNFSSLSNTTEQSVEKRRISNGFRHHLRRHNSRNKNSLPNSSINGSSSAGLRGKRVRGNIGSLRSHRRRRVTKELREFWNKLDQRNLLKNSSAHHIPNGELESSSKNSNSTTMSLKPTLNDSFYEDFPFLAENYDYANYYYVDDDMPTGSEASSPVLSTNSSVSSVNVTNSQLEKQEMVLNLTSTGKSVSSDNIAEITTIKLPNTTTESSPRRSKILRLQGRKMPDFTTDESKLFIAHSPQTAIDSFRNRRIAGSDQDGFNKPRDILKEFPIFRQLKRPNAEATREKSSRKLSLHERLKSRRNGGEAAVPTTLTTTEIPTGSQNLGDEKSLPHNKINSTISEKSPDRKIPALPHASNKNDSLDETTQVPSSNLAPEHDVTSVTTNVTFSTRRTQGSLQPQPASADAFRLSLLESQLGIAPLGDAPFGLAPFGDAPMGEKPFGQTPQGIAPLGNLTSPTVLNQNATNGNASTDGSDGRYHVQVTAPDGSINGDYVVVDPVTGDLNGVRYEAAQDVDPILVQRALLNFLSLGSPGPGALGIITNDDQSNAHQQEQIPSSNNENSDPASSDASNLSSSNVSSGSTTDVGQLSPQNSTPTSISTTAPSPASNLTTGVSTLNNSDDIKNVSEVEILGDNKSQIKNDDGQEPSTSSLPTISEPVAPDLIDIVTEPLPPLE